MEILLGFFIVVLIIVIVGIGKISGRTLNRRIDRASRDGDFDEYSRLLQIKMDRQRKQHEAAHRTATDQRYLDAILILDAADDGVFLPDGEQAFNALDQPQYPENDYEGYGDKYYDYDPDYDPGPESEDYWGP